MNQIYLSDDNLEIIHKLVCDGMNQISDENLTEEIINAVTLFSAQTPIHKFDHV